MATSTRALLLSAILIMAASAFGQINIVNFDFGAVLVQCSNGYAYQGAVTSCPYGYNTQDFNQSPASDGSWEESQPGNWLRLPWRAEPGLLAQIRYSFRRPSTDCPSIKQYSCRTSEGLCGKSLEVSQPEEPTR